MTKITISKVKGTLNESGVDVFFKGGIVTRYNLTVH